MQREVSMAGGYRTVPSYTVLRIVRLGPSTQQRKGPILLLGFISSA